VRNVNPDPTEKVIEDAPMLGTVRETPPMHSTKHDPANVNKSTSQPDGPDPITGESGPQLAVTLELAIVILEIVPPPDDPPPIPEPPPPRLLAFTVPPAIKIVPIDDLALAFSTGAHPIPEPDSSLVALTVALEIVIWSILESPSPEQSPVPIPAPMDVEFATMFPPVTFNSRNKDSSPLEAREVPIPVPPYALTATFRISNEAQDEFLPAPIAATSLCVEADIESPNNPFSMLTFESSAQWIAGVKSELNELLPRNKKTLTELCLTSRELEFTASI
jgi:hypothetical protein